MPANSKITFSRTDSPNRIRVQVSGDRSAGPVIFDVEIRCCDPAGDLIPLSAGNRVHEAFTSSVLPLIHNAPRLMSPIRDLVALERKRLSQGELSAIQLQAFHVVMLEAEAIIDVLDKQSARNEAEASDDDPTDGSDASPS